MCRFSEGGFMTCDDFVKLEGSLDDMEKTVITWVQNRISHLAEIDYVFAVPFKDDPDSTMMESKARTMGGIKV